MPPIVPVPAQAKNGADNRDSGTPSTASLLSIFTLPPAFGAYATKSALELVLPPLPDADSVKVLQPQTKARPEFFQFGKSLHDRDFNTAAASAARLRGDHPAAEHFQRLAESTEQRIVVERTLRQAAQILERLQRSFMPPGPDTAPDPKK